MTFAFATTLIGGDGSTVISASNPFPTYTVNSVLTPTVTAGAYSAGDIMGGLLTFSSICPQAGTGLVIQELIFGFKSAVTPSLQLVLFNADPTGTTQTDNAAYSLAVADMGKVIAALPINSLGGYLVDHGTPNTIHLNNMALAVKPTSASTTLYGLLVDLTGVTLSSTSDLQISMLGIGA